MPAPTPEELSKAAVDYFVALGIKLPMDWTPKGSQYNDAFTLQELSTPANPSDNPFFEPTYNHYHTLAARVMGRDYKQYMEGTCAAISEAIDIWMKNASIVNVELVGTIGTVLPMSEFDGTGLADESGQELTPDSESEIPTRIGPELKPLILSKAPQRTKQEQDYSVAIATAISENWDIWANALTGVITYPPFGPPQPNIPQPLMTLSSTGEPNLDPQLVGDQIFKYLGDPGALHAKELFMSIAHSFFVNFQVFKTKTVVAGVIMTPPTPPPPPPPPVEEEIPEEEEEELEEEEEEEEEGEEGEESEEDEASEEEEAAEEEEVEEEPEEELPEEPEPEEEPLPPAGGLVIPSPGNFV